MQRWSQRIWQSYTCLCLPVLFGSVLFGLVWFGRFLGVINSCLSVRSTSVAVSCVFFYVQLGLTNSHPCSRNAFVFDVNSSIFFL